MSHSMTDPAGQTCEHGVRWAFDCAQCGEFGETLQFCSFPKLSTNSAWKLVPVEPTPEMLEAMQAAGLAAFDADVAASLGDAPLDPTHARCAIWRAALDAAPEAPSVEPVAWFTPGAKGVLLVSHAPMSSRSYPVFASPPDHRKVMRLALEALEVGRRYVYADDRPQLENAIDALRKALASDALDRLAQADWELGLGERA